MAFTQEPVNYAVEYAKELANAYPYLSYFNEIWNGPNSTKYKPVNGKTIMVPSMSTSGARAVDRDRIDGVFTRNWNNDFQPLTMRMDREWDTLVDPMDIQETNMVATIANITETFNQFQKVPAQVLYFTQQGMETVLTGETGQAFTVGKVSVSGGGRAADSNATAASRMISPLAVLLLEQTPLLERRVAVCSDRFPVFY